MSTQEPGAPQPEGTAPGYAQPQDPWAGGFEYGHGQASMPTDPVPPQFDPYLTYGQQFPGHTDPWSGQTVNQGGPGWPGQPGQEAANRGPSRSVPVLIALLVIVLLGAAGGAIWWFVNQRPGTVTGTPTPSVAPSGTTSPGSSAPPVFDPHTVVEGDCLFNFGEDTRPRMRVVDCSTKNAFKVIKIFPGEPLPENTQDKFDQYTAAQVCDGVKGYKHYYAFDAEDDSQDLIFCMSK